MSIKKILVTGANGQLGWEITQLAASYPMYEFIFADRSMFDLSKPELFESLIQQWAPQAIINTAAYTAVDKAEAEQALATLINATAVAELARIAGKNDILFVTFSTDYVFNGNATSPYLTDTIIDPVNFYGTTKAHGEDLALAVNPNTIIIRTSWVFSSHGNNFVKTMMRLMKDKDALNIVGDQRGRPTYAKDLALATIQILIALNAGTVIKGIYHYANSGETTWFKFAEKIKELAGLECNLTAITSDQFPTLAKRPSYSVLDTDKIEKDLGLHIPQWEIALKECIHQLTHS
jgi:dTDP-4-dehydrorhamnose reductase